ncbi:hypothetical protein PSTT_00165 [Puccinia striiformis]|uniref:Uncharacterized protein n=2 Tax=Puccinia striiformis TaxID=27350 RepID=A0A0L0VCL3_9BASI|nr:hypothetical protein PSTG_10000 [Puccinia striiformis f. sp. tritici PST-78]POW18067.1 hypothetical protein PSTT_00165 [Puccinia striiformis]
MFPLCHVWMHALYTNSAIQKRLQSKSKDYLKKNLLPKYPDDNSNSVASVNSEIKFQLKQVQHQTCNILLTGIVAEKNVKLPRIPTIMELSRPLWRYFCASTRLSDNVVDELVLPMIKVSHFTQLPLLSTSPVPSS